MAKTTTYSFLDLSGVISHGSVGSYTFNGEGVGELTIGYATERTAHDVAADGSVMVSKIPGNNGTVTMNVQQTSALHKWLVNAFNAVWLLATSQWAGFAMTFRNTSDGTSHVLSGVSFQKLADKPYQAQGQRCSWTLMAADIQSANVS